MSSENGENHDHNGDVSQAGLSERRAQLNRKLEDQRAVEQKAARKSESNSSGYAQAMKLSSEFIAGVLVGAGIGWVADQWLGTTPFGLIIFLLLGFAAGVLNVLRSTGAVEQPQVGLRRDEDVRKDGSD